MLLILLIVVLVPMFGGGGGYYGYRRWLASMTGEGDERIAFRRGDEASNLNTKSEATSPSSPLTPGDALVSQ